MCGLCGYIDPWNRGGRDVLVRMADLLRHRGPDDAGVAQGEGWGLGFRRLAILDLSPNGHQPMSYGNGRFHLAFNGEIYNHVELRRDLEAEGERFRGGSDTEVLLRLLARRGEAALPLLNGMFAFALIDTERRTFLLARDRLGVKPLYYATGGGSLRFASEPKAMLAWPGERREIDDAAVARYLALGYLPGESAIFRGHAKLPPAHVLAGSLDDPSAARLRPYWDLSLSDDPTRRPLSPGETEELEHLLRDAVRIRLRSDVPVGVFLSGGLDSGLVAACAADVPGPRPLALTVGFAEGEANETDLAAATARHVGLDHRVVAQKPDGLDRLDELAWFFDEPFGDPSALPTFTLCEAAATVGRVFLSGDGGDEAFAGYRRYVEALRHRRVIDAAQFVGPTLRRVAGLAPALSPLRARLAKLGLPDRGCAAAFDDLPADPALAAVAHPRLRPLLAEAAAPLWARWARSRGRATILRQQELDYRLYLPDDVLVKVDRASMAHSVEVRSPLLDIRLVEWAARLPRGALLDAHEGKLPLRALGRRLLPTAVERGAKRGFGVPLDAWLREAKGQALVRERLLGAHGTDLGHWDRRGVGRILDVHGSGAGRGFGVLLWRLLMLEAWTRQHAARTRPAEARHGERAGRPAPGCTRAHAGQASF